MQLMNRHLTALICAFLLVLCGCQREPIVPNEGTYSFGLSVWNEDYTEDFALDKMGLVELSSVESLPSWIGGVSLSQDTDRDVTFAHIDVKRTSDLPSE